MKSAHLLKNKLSILFVVLGSVVFSLVSSCKKDNEINRKEVIGEAKIKLINASESSSAVDFYLNDTKINSSSLAYGESSDYIRISSGIKIAKVNHGLTILDTSLDFNFIPTLSYTAFFVEDKNKKGEILTFEDNLGALESGKSRVRFINLSPNFTNSVNVSMVGGELLVNGLPFKGESGYFMLQSGMNVAISIPGTGVFKIVSGSEFEEGKNYTIWLSGSSNANLTINKITYN